MSNKESIPEEELSWINSSLGNSVVAYIYKYDLCEKMSAHRRYKSLVESKSNVLSGAEKKAIDSFEHWKTSKGHQFWLDRRTHVSTIISAGSIAESTPPYMEKSLKRNLSRMDDEAAVQTDCGTTPDARTDNGMSVCSFLWSQSLTMFMSANLFFS